MKKYIIIALLLGIFQSTIYCQDYINQILMPQLKSAQYLMKSSTSLELQAILDALISFAKKGEAQANAAIDRMKEIKIILQKYKSEQYKTTWDDISWFFGSNPKKVTEEIDPAIEKVNKALKALNANSSYLGYKIAAAAALGIIALIAWNRSQRIDAPKSAAPQETYASLFEQAKDADDGISEKYNDTQLYYLYKIFGLRKNASNNEVEQRYQQMLHENLTQDDLVIVKQAHDAIIYDYIIPRDIVL